MKLKNRSLSFKLTLAFLVVSLMGTVLVAALVNWQTRRQFDTFVNDFYQDDILRLGDQLAAYYQQNANWDGVEDALFETHPSSEFEAQPPEFEPDELERRLPVTFVDSEQQVVFGSHHYQPGEKLATSQIENGLPVEVNGETVGWITLDSFEGNRDDFFGSPEAKFLTNLNQATLLIAFGAAILALSLGVALARTISHPISELKTATQRVAQGQLGHQVTVRSLDEIGQLAGSFNQMSADLAHSNELRRQMTADIAHDLRTPLSVIQGYAEGLDEGKLQGSSEIYGAIHKQVKHLNRLVEDLRTLSLADAGQLSLHMQKIASRDLLEHSFLVFAPQAEQQQVSLHLNLPDRLPDITVDPDRIVQVLGNLISNALRHTPSGGDIRLSAVRNDQTLVLQVQDTGTGIKPEDVPHVFDRFYRGEKYRPETGESGLGLAIARSIVEAHNGRISVESILGQGTTFNVTLPAL